MFDYCDKKIYVWDVAIIIKVKVGKDERFERMCIKDDILFVGKG